MNQGKVSEAKSKENVPVLEHLVHAKEETSGPDPHVGFSHGVLKF